MTSMQQIRFDFLSSVNGTGNSRNPNANANTAEAGGGDAFAQILDQQLTRRADTGNRRSEARSRADGIERAENPRPQVTKRRDAKNATTAPAHDKPEAKTAR